jgi:hypothetical protein
VDSIKIFIDKTNKTLDQLLVARPSTIASQMVKYNFEVGNQQANILLKNLMKILTGDSENILKSAAEIGGDNFLHSAIAVAILNVVLKPFSDKGDFCYPKDMMSFVVDTSGNQCNNDNYNKLKVTKLAETVVKYRLRKNSDVIEPI